MVYIDDFISDRKTLELVLDNLKDGIVAHDLERKIIFFNKEAEKITGFSKDDVMGKDCHKAFGAPFCGDRCSFCGEVPTLKDRLEFPTTFISKSGEIRHIEMSITGIFDKDIFKGVIASFKDMTEYTELAARAEELTSFSGIIGTASSMRQIFQQITDVAKYDYPVHIHGETGTGKERVAAAIHSESKRTRAAFVPVNCGAIPEGLVESELFGHVKGAFSGAVKDRKGRFELAHNGTLFLDEVAELPKQMQVKLLRFLQEGVVERVGSETTINVDVRIISATNKNLSAEVEKGNFRKDLFYRLNVIPIKLPPLRERRNDIPLLSAHFLKRAEDENNGIIPAFSKDAMRALMDYDWPGNVRELQNAVQFAIVRCKSNEIMPIDLPMELRNTPENRQISRVYQERKTIGKLDLDAVKTALERTGGNKAKAARELGVGRATLYRFLEKDAQAADFAAAFK
ncbi:sigma-54 dependent sensory box histidine kinase/response regulator [Desulforapulum autotrophicum HRM2]|uniref:Sigma-54 dependent sensory box histidine kinase/response regulator n=1 Tax=Desulforapulum autotrophicum (strain ATCC 43914 / DSM 3382 / VKM B-1955 / HRM2) TaxID=177437 RepID=C0QD26_DESAH|nr:sigma-54-dependent Fis family transcriptional regulator [Desulforapulum autotrophicum]ACN17258.1 sigma-54 dependent sensory box histidine kinase/response regulator [Desulforapulum autotrophicum HRM2]